MLFIAEIFSENNLTFSFFKLLFMRSLIYFYRKVMYIIKKGDLLVAYQSNETKHLLIQICK